MELRKSGRGAGRLAVHFLCASAPLRENVFLGLWKEAHVHSGNQKEERTLATTAWASGSWSFSSGML